MIWYDMVLFRPFKKDKHGQAVPFLVYDGYRWFMPVVGALFLYENRWTKNKTTSGGIKLFYLIKPSARLQKSLRTATFLTKNCLFMRQVWDGKGSE